ncbi:MAG: S9 family peptidase [Chloracidobacterium sp.]|nr:S9 family peptidase [Chloracidobacterium sp.]
MKNQRTFPPVNAALRVAFFVFALSPLQVLHAQGTQPAVDPKLTVDRIFASAEFRPERFGGFDWLKDGDSYAKFEPSEKVKDAIDLVRYQIDTEKRDVLLSAERLIPKGESKPLQMDGYDWSADGKKMLIYTNSQKVWRYNTRGDYWVLDLDSGKLSKLGGDAKPATLMFAKFSPDGTRVGYVRENDLYVEDVATGKITRLTKDGSHTLINGTSDWVNEEEFDLRDCWRWSPDSRSIAFWQFDASGIEDFILLDNTQGLYPKLTKIPYPKTGTQNAAVRVGVIAAGGGPIKWLETPGDLRNNYIVSVDWSSPSEIYLQHFNRLQNTLQVLVADAKSGKSRSILTEKDDTWVDLTLPEMKWLDGGKRFLWISERDGWRRPYSVSADGRDIRPLTRGAFDAMSVQSIDETGGWVYYIASPDNATQRYLYRSRLDGSGTDERVTPAEFKGWNNYNFSPNSKWAIQSSSSFGKPSRIDLLNLSDKSVARNIVGNSKLRAQLDQLPKGPAEFFRIDIGDGVALDGWMMKPPGFDPSKKYPVLFYAYTEPAGTTVNDSWTGSQYLWYLMLTQQGYIVASVDNRGTPSPRGRAFRKSIYRKIGVLSSADQAAAAKAMLAKMPYLDASRVGIWGWSGGGVATLNAMFRYPDVYKMGMAVAPAPDNRYYDTIYTERYMGLPKDNPKDYENTAATTFAENLKGDLLIVHGTGDDNVHYQQTEYLINKLIAANKVFTIMPYPNRTHSISEGQGTTLHLYSLLTRYLNEHLPAKAEAALIPE